jgi:hypothetical protein
MEYGWNGGGGGLDPEDASFIKVDNEQSNPSEFIKFMESVALGTTGVCKFKKNKLRLIVVCCHGLFMKEVRKHFDAPSVKIENYNAFAICLNPDQNWTCGDMHSFVTLPTPGMIVVLVRHCPRLCQNYQTLNPLSKEHRVRDPRCQKDTVALHDLRKLYWAPLIQLYLRTDASERCVASSCLRRAQETAYQFIETLHENDHTNLTNRRPVFWKRSILLPNEPKQVIIPILPFCKEGYNKYVWRDFKDMCTSIRHQVQSSETLYKRKLTESENTRNTARKMIDFLT